jgi:hypothetical protein
MRDPETAYARTPIDTSTALATVDRRRVVVQGGEIIQRDYDTFQGRPISPGPPLIPWLPRGEDPRQFYIQAGYNYNYVPRREFPQLTPFALLRNLAASSDLVQIARQEVIDSILALEWDVVPTDPHEQRAKGLRAECDYAKSFLEYPDRIHSFEGWLHALLLDALDIDALCFYRRRTLGGEPHSLLPVDGATIKPILDWHGIPPEPPEVAYQQIIAGVPETEFSRPYLPVMEGEAEDHPTELVYSPFSPRTTGGYGQSPLERVLITVNLALRRQLHHLAYFTDGNIPDAFWKCPDKWQAEQIFDFQDKLEKLLSGESGSRRKLRMMPGGEGTGLELPHGTEQEPNDLNEFLSRVISMAYHTSPQPLVRMMNRATSEQADTSSSESGLHTWLHKIRKMVTREIREFLALGPAVKFIYVEDKHRDEAAWTNKAVAWVGKGIYTRNHVLNEEGLDPIEGGDVATVDTPSGPVPLASFVGDASVALTPSGGGGEAARILAAVPPISAAGETGARNPIEAQPTGPQPTSAMPAKPGTPAAPDVAVQDTALNGAQVESLVLIVQQVANGVIPLETGIVLITEAFPGIDEETALRMLAPVKAAGPGVAVGSESAESVVAAAPAIPAAKSALDLKRWRKVAAKLLAAEPDWKRRSPEMWAKAMTFRSETIPPALQEAIRLSLADLAFAPEAEHRLDWTFRVMVKSRRPVVAVRRRLRHERAVRAVVRKHFKARTPAVVAVALKTFRELRKDDAPTLEGLEEALQVDVLAEELTVPLRDAYLDGEVLAADESGIEIQYGLTDEQATKYAEERAAELVGKRKMPDGTFIDSPDRKMAITETLRKDLQAAVKNALATGATETELRDLIEAETGWTYRADRIARTEVAFALNRGAAETYSGAGVSTVTIMDGEGCLEDGHDDSEEGVDGEVWTVAKWQQYPIGHPACVRDARPNVGTEGLAE